MCRVAVTGALLVVLALVVPLASGQGLYGKKTDDEHKVHDPCESVICTTGKDGRRTFCRVVHVCDKPDDLGDCVCNFTLPVCVSKASSDSYYDYQPQKSVCKKGSPVIKLSGEVKPCNETDDCPMGYECVDSKYGLPIRPDDTDGVCCLEQKKMKKPPTCPKVAPKSFHKTSSYYGNDYYKPIDICMTKCYSDYDCDYDEICCYTGCGYKCISTLDPTTTTTTTTTPIPTTTSAMTTTPIAPATGDTTTPTPTPIVVAQSTSGGGGGSISAGGGGSGTTPRPASRGLRFNDHPKCPADPADVICGQFMCYSDHDCPNGQACCDSATCLDNGTPGTACVTVMASKKKSRKKFPFPGPSTTYGFPSPFDDHGKPHPDPKEDLFHLPTFPKKKESSVYGFPFPSSKPKFDFGKPSFQKSGFPSLSNNIYTGPSPTFGFDSYGKPSKHSNLYDTGVSKDSEYHKMDPGEYHNMDSDEYNTSMDPGEYHNMDPDSYGKMDAYEKDSGYGTMKGYKDDSKYPVNAESYSFGFP